MKHRAPNRVVFTGGGSGGHVYPALALIRRLQTEMACLPVWFGSRRGVEKNILAAETDLPYYSIPCGKWRRYASWRNLTDLFRTAAGILYSYCFLWTLRPRWIFSKGGFVAVPTLIAARLQKIPIFAHESDLDPGLATKISLRLADQLFISYPESLPFYPARYRGKLTVTGNPIREEFLRPPEPEFPDPYLPGDWFEPGSRTLKRPLITVLGGSLGSEQINTLIGALLEQPGADQYYIFHQCGPAQQQICQTWQQKYPHYRAEGLIRIPQSISLYRRAALIVCRAGANTLWEVLASRVPNLLIPLVAGSRGEQLRNADFFSSKGWSYTFTKRETQELNAEKLFCKIQTILNDKLKPRPNKIVSYDPTQKITDILKEFL